MRSKLRQHTNAPHRRTGARTAVSIIQRVFLLAAACLLLFITMMQGGAGAAARLPALPKPVEQTGAGQAAPDSPGLYQADESTPTPVDLPGAPKLSDTPLPTEAPLPTGTEPAATQEDPPTTEPQITPTDLPTPTPQGTRVDPTAAFTLQPTGWFTPTALPSMTLTITPKPTSGTEPYKIYGPHVPGELIVQFKPKAKPDAIKALFESIGAASTYQIPDLNAWLVKLPEENLETALALLQDAKGVRFVEPNYLATALASPGDPAADRQPHLNAIQMPAAWEVTRGSPSVLIAVVDTGVDLNHPDLAQKIWQNSGEMGQDKRGRDKRTNGRDDDKNGFVDDWSGWNALNNDGQVHDQNGHGTHVAGIAAADTDNGIGVAGVGWKSSLLIVRALDGSGSGGYAQVAMAVVYAVRQRARVINLSLGGSSYSRLLEMAISYASANGVVVVAATGRDAALYPAVFNSVISVGAVDGNNKPVFGHAPDDNSFIYAPGKGIYSTALGGGYEPRSGSSMAAAQVSGVAALMFSVPQFGSGHQIQQALLSSSTRPANAPGGVRVLNAYQAVTFAGLPATPTATLTATELPGQPLDVFPMLPTAGIAPPGPTSTPLPSDPHVHYQATTGSCASCHRSHTAQEAALRYTWPEEAVCFACHTAGGNATNVEPAFSSYTNTGTRYFKHDIILRNGAHQTGENSPSSFGGANRHVECEDCHDAHDAARGATYPPMSQFELGRASGVDPIWTAQGAPAGYTWLSRAEREYQVCFKCHSSYTVLPAYSPDGWDGANFVANGLFKLGLSTTTQKPDYRDLALEFNPNNASFHPVAAQGRNQSIPPGSFVNGWSQTSLMYCGDCHTNASAATQGFGPHGSPLLHLLDGQNNYLTVDANQSLSSGELCFRCHSYAIYVTTGSSTVTNFREGDKNLHALHTREERSPCYVCHDSHGSEQLHLINFNTQVVTITGVNRDSQNAWEINTTTNERTCYLSCHNEEHGAGKSYTP